MLLHHLEAWGDKVIFVNRQNKKIKKLKKIINKNIFKMRKDK
jgi:hypothetical protein